MKMRQKAQFCASEKNPVSDMDIDHMQDCGNTMPAFPDPVPFHSGQVENFNLLVLGQVQNLYKG